MGGRVDGKGRTRGAWAVGLLVFVGAIAVASVRGALARAGDGDAPPAAPAKPSPNDGCLACHADPAKAGKHLVDAKAHAASVHGK